MTDKSQKILVLERALAALNMMTSEEDVEITAAALADPDAQPLSEEFMAGMRPVRDEPELLRTLQAAQALLRRRMDAEKADD